MADIRFNQEGEAVELRDNNWIPVRRAVNPETGERVYYYNGNWQTRSRIVGGIGETSARGGATASPGARFATDALPVPDYLRDRQIPQTVESVVRQVPTGVEALVPSAINALGRLVPTNYRGEGLGQYLPGSGQYDAPLATLEQRRQRDVERTGNPALDWQGTTPESRVLQAGLSGALEGGIVGGVVSGGRVALRSGVRAAQNARRAPGAARQSVRPTPGEVGFAARDTGYEALVSGGAAAGGAALAEAAGPGVGAAGAIALGSGGGNVAFGRNAAENTARRIMSESFTSQDYARAREIIEDARLAGVEDLTPIEALAYAAPDRADGLWQAYRSTVELRGTVDPLQQNARARVSDFEDAFNQEISRVIGADPMAPPRGPGQVQRAAAEGARSAIVRARNEVASQITPLYRATRGQNLPIVVGEGGQRLPLVDRVRSDLQEALRGQPPNSDAADGIRDVIRRLEGVENVDMFDSTLREINEAMRAGDPQRSAGLNAANAVTGPILEAADNMVLAASPELSRARVLRRRLQEETIAPIESALDAIANPTRRANAQSVVRDLVGTSAGPEIDPERLQLGFSAIIDHDADLAGEILGIYLGDAVRRGFETDISGRARINAPGQVARTLIGDNTRERNLRFMFNELDSARNIAAGTSWTAFNRLLETAQAASTAPAYGATSMARSAADVQESQRSAGASAQGLLGQIVAPVTQSGRAVNEFLRQRAYDRIIDAFTSTAANDVERIRRMADSPVGSRLILSETARIIAGQQAYESQTDGQQ